VLPIYVITESLTTLVSGIQQVAEHRGWHWALTSFAAEAWNKTKMKLLEV